MHAYTDAAAADSGASYTSNLQVDGSTGVYDLPRPLNGTLDIVQLFENT